MPQDATYNVPTLDDFAAWYALQLVTPAGEQFGSLATAVNDALGFAKSTFVDPAVSTITGWVAEIGKTFWHTLMGGLGFVLKWAYSILRGWMLGNLPSSEWGRFPDPNTIVGSDPLWILSLIVNLLWFNVYYTVWNVGRWVWDTVKAGLGYAAEGAATLKDWIRVTIDFYILWLRDRVRDLLGYAAEGAVSLVAWIRTTLDFYAHWLLDQVKAALTAIPGIPGTLLDSISSLVNTAAAWVRDRVQEIVNALWALVQPAIANVASLVSKFGQAIGTRIADTANWLWGLIGPKLDAIGSAVVSGAQEVLSGLGGILKDAFTWIFQQLLAPFVDVFKHKATIPGRVLAGEYATFGAFIEDLMDPPDSVFQGIQFFFWSIFALVLSVIIGFVPAFAPVNQKWAMETARSVAPSQPPVSTLLTMLRRGLVSEPEARLSLERQGYNAGWISALIATEEVLPGVSDMIRMGVREAFTPAIAETFGQYQDLPPALVEWGDKIGLSQDWVSRFWAAHWDLPSAEQMFEMLHRGIISRDELLLGLRAADIMPFWRDRLNQIAYRIPTRVDIRRMYHAGAVDLAYVHQKMLDSGYRPEDAAAITEWVRVTYDPNSTSALTKRKDLTEAAIKQAYARRLVTRDEALEQLGELGYTADEADFVISIWDFDFFQNPNWRSDIQPKELTRSIIEQAYARGLVDANAASAQLEELGFTPEDAALLLQLVDYKNNADLSDLEADIAVQKYRAGVIDEATLAAQLRDINIPEARIELMVTQETLRRQAKPARLTLAQLQRAFRGSVIDQAEFVTRLDAMGYNDRDVQILVAIT